MVEAEDVTGVTFTPEYVSLFLSLPLYRLFLLSLCSPESWYLVMLLGER